MTGLHPQETHPRIMSRPDGRPGAHVVVLLTE
jgi:hypothetical protein